MTDVEAKIIEIEKQIAGMGSIAVAVSGGIDSMTLAGLANRANDRVTIYHAISPAVPQQATRRVKDLASERKWSLVSLDAKEFSDEDYLANPVDRCFFCKSNLYRAISERTKDPILSGTNKDDLSDYRPGLDAAKQLNVRHPFAENGVRKPVIRLIAKLIGMNHLSEMPASPCLSSRIETGIRIDPVLLPLINEAEILVKKMMLNESSTVRCRVRPSGIVIELDKLSLESLTQNVTELLVEQLSAIFQGIGYSQPIAFELYELGSAFIKINANSIGLRA